MVWHIFENIQKSQYFCFWKYLLPASKEMKLLLLYSECYLEDLFQIGMFGVIGVLWDHQFYFFFLCR